MCIGESRLLHAQERAVGVISTDEVMALLGVVLQPTGMSESVAFMVRRAGGS